MSEKKHHPIPSGLKIKEKKLIKILKIIFILFTLTKMKPRPFQRIRSLYFR